MVARNLEFGIDARPEGVNLFYPIGDDNNIGIDKDGEAYFIIGPTKESKYLMRDLGVTPLSFAEVMHYRVSAANTTDRAEKKRRMALWWWVIDSDTPGLVTSTDVRLRPKDITITTAKGKETFARGDLFARPLKREEIPAHPVWAWLAENDTALLKEYADITFSLCKQYRDECMGIALSEYSFWPGLVLEPEPATPMDEIVKTQAVAIYLDSKLMYERKREEFGHGFDAFIGEPIEDIFAAYAAKKKKETVGTRTIDKILGAFQ